MSTTTRDYCPPTPTTDNVEITTVACIGAGRIGVPTMAVMAQKLPELKFLIFDDNKDKIEQWNKEDEAEWPLYEPELGSLLKEVKNKNLFFVDDFAKAVKDAEAIFIAISAPSKRQGGKGSSVELKMLENVAQRLHQHVTYGRRIVIETSVVPLRCSETLTTVFKSLSKVAPGPRFDVLSVPAFTYVGFAVSNCQTPDRVLIGGQNETALRTIVDLYAKWVPRERIVTSNLWSAELAKLTTITFLAQRVSSINAIASFCETTGANAYEVSKAVGTDKRIGPNYLMPSVGWGGVSFRKAVESIVYLAEYYRLDPVADYFHSIITMNEYSKKRFVNKIVNKMFNTVTEKGIVVLGFAFKKNTSDTRDSPAIDVCSSLLKEGANITIYDPKVPEQQIRQDLALAVNGKYDPEYIPRKGEKIAADLVQQNVKVAHSAQDVYAAAQGASAVVVLTEWDEFKTLDYQQIYSVMQKPAFLFDGRGILPQNEMQTIGFETYRIGVPDSVSTAE